MKKSIFILILVSLFITILSGCVKIPMKLSINEKNGEVFKVEIDRNQKISSNFQGDNANVQLKIRESFLCNIINVDDIKDSQIKVTFDSIKFTNNVVASDILKAYLPNTQDYFKNILDAYTHFIGKSFKVKIGENGKVKKVMGIDELTKSILKEVKDKTKQEDVKKFLKDEFSENALMAKIEKITLFYPENRVSVGSKWKMKNTPSNKIPIECINEYTLKDNRDKSLDILVKSNIKKNESEKPKAIDDVKLSYEDIKGDGSGSIRVNSEKGLIKNFDIQSNFKGNIKIVSSNPDKGTEMIPINVQDKMTVNVLNQ